MARDRISRSSSDCFKAHDAARCSALSRLRAFRAPDLTEFEISSNADKIWSSSVSSERKTEETPASLLEFPSRDLWRVPWHSTCDWPGIVPRAPLGPQCTRQNVAETSVP